MALLSILNRLLPFATAGTSLLQDLVHLAAICVLLYFAPQIQQQLQARTTAQRNNAADAEPILDEHQRAAVVGDNAVEPGLERNGEAIVDAAAGDMEEVQPPPDGIAENGLPGPAEAVNIPPPRNVGAKKAKSLARRDQRRAYNEFMRSQGEAQRARDAEGAAEREAALAAEKERRKAAATTLEEKRAKEREQRRQREEADRVEELRRRELAVTLVKEELEARKMCDLFKVARQVGNDVDEEWVENLIKAVGMIGRKGNNLTMVTGMGWVVRVTGEDMAKLYAVAAETKLGGEDGRVEYGQLSAIMETILCG